MFSWNKIAPRQKCQKCGNVLDYDKGSPVDQWCEPVCLSCRLIPIGLDWLNAVREALKPKASDEL